MFTIKIAPQDRPFDVIALAAEQYKKEMSSMGYNLWYVPYGKPHNWCGVGLFEGDTAYIENAAGTTIDKVEGFEKRAAPPDLTGPTPQPDSERRLASVEPPRVFTQRTQSLDDAVEAIRNLGTDPAVTAMRAAHRASGDEA